MGRQAQFPTMLYHSSLHLFHPESTSLSLVQTLRITTLPSSHGPFSWILPAAYATTPTSPFTGRQGIVNRHCPILGHLLEGARCLLPFTGLALPQISLQLKWWSLPLSSSDYTGVMVFFWTTKVTSVIFYIISRLPTVNMIYRYWCWSCSPGQDSVCLGSPM